MRNGPRFDAWIVGLLVSVCLFGAAILLLRFNVGGLLNIPQQNSAAFTSSASTLPQPLPSQSVTAFPADPQRKESLWSAARKHRAGASFSHPALKQDSPDMSMTAQAVINPTPERKILKPLGYVQKTDGTIEAIVPDGDGVQVVHVGDPYQEKYTVAQISPHGVVILPRAVTAVPPDNSQTVLTAATLGPGKS